MGALEAELKKTLQLGLAEIKEQVAKKSDEVDLVETTSGPKSENQQDFSTQQAATEDVEYLKSSESDRESIKGQPPVNESNAPSTVQNDATAKEIPQSAADPMSYSHGSSRRGRHLEEYDEDPSLFERMRKSWACWSKDGSSEHELLYKRGQALEKKIKTLTEDNEDLRRERDSNRLALQSARRELREWEHRCSMINQACEEKHNAWLLTKNLLQEERAFVKELQEEQRKLRTGPTEEQRSRMSKFTAAVSSELPDDVVKENFEDLFEDTMDWARKNSTNKFDRTVVAKQFVQSAILREEHDLDNFLSSGLSVSAAADTLLLAALNHELCLAFLTNPYFLGDEMQLETGDVTERIGEHLHMTDCFHEFETRIRSGKFFFVPEILKIYLITIRNSRICDSLAQRYGQGTWRI